MPRSFLDARSARVGLAVTLLASGLALSGCEEDNVSPALAQASATLESLGSPGSGVPGDAFREAEYREAINTLKPVMGEGSEAQNAAAALMIARAELGLAETKLRRVVQAHDRMYALVGKLRSEYTEWSTLNSLAETSESYDPSEEQAKLNELIQERDRQIAEAEEAKRAVEQQVADLEAQAEEASQKAAEVRGRELEQRDQTSTLNARDALPFHMEAGRLRREADAYEVEMEQRLNEADLIRPQILEKELEVERLTSQRDDLVKSTQEVAAIAVEGRDEARRLREQASETASRIDTLLSELDTLRTGELDTALNEARSALESAASSAGRARTGDRNGANLTTGEIQQTLGTLEMTHAAALAHAAAVIEQIAGARAPLPSSDRVQSAASALLDAAEQARQSAIESFTEARDAYESASIRGEGADRIDATTSAIAQSIETLGGPAAEPEEMMPEDDFEGMGEDGMPPADDAQGEMDAEPETEGEPLENTDDDDGEGGGA